MHSDQEDAPISEEIIAVLMAAVCQASEGAVQVKKIRRQCLSPWVSDSWLWQDNEPRMLVTQ